MFGGLPLAPSVRAAVARRCGGACENCGLDWPWALYVFRVDEGGAIRAENLTVLCFACHHHVQPCATGCGGWAKKPRTVCRNCLTRRSLEELFPDSTWEEIKARNPGFVASWKPGYEPRNQSGL